MSQATATIERQATENAETHPGMRLVLAGTWFRGMDAKPSSVQELLDSQPPPKNGEDCILVADGGIEKWDSTLLLYLARLRKEGEARGFHCDFSALPDGIVRLMRLSGAPPARTREEEDASVEQSIVEMAGHLGLNVSERVAKIAHFIGELTLALCRLPFGRTRMRRQDFFHEALECGPRALWIIALISFLMGLIMAFIGSIPLKWFRAEVYVASLVGIGMLRLLGPVMVGVVMAGRTSAAYAAQLGTMQVNEEIDALKTIGLPPMDFLILPRILAMTMMLPVLCAFSDLFSILGGMLVAVAYLDTSPLAYFHTLTATTRISDLFVGIFTAWVLGMLDAICGCYQGIECGRSAAAVGSSTTSAVVYSIICIVIATSLITILSVVLSI